MILSPTQTAAMADPRGLAEALASNARFAQAAGKRAWGAGDTAEAVRCWRMAAGYRRALRMLAARLP